MATKKSNARKSGRIVAKNSKSIKIQPGPTPTTVQLDLSGVTASGWLAVDQLVNEVKSLVAARIETEAAIKEAQAKRDALAARAEKIVAAIGGQDVDRLAALKAKNDATREKLASKAATKPAKGPRSKRDDAMPGKSPSSYRTAWSRLVKAKASKAEIDAAYETYVRVRKAYQADRRADAAKK